MMLLPDVSDFTIPKRGKLRFREPSNILMFVVYRPFSGRVESTDEVEQGALACSALADYGDLFTGLNLEREIAKNDQIFIAGTIDLRQILDTNEWLGSHSSV